MKHYNAYLFDFDYTLADSSRGIVMCFRRVLERHHYSQVTDNEIKRTIGKTLENSFSILTGVTDTDTLAAYKKEYVKEADVYMTANTFLFPETAEVLNGLKKRGAKIGIISTKFRYRIMELLSNEGLLFAMQRLGCSKEETLYIGDSTVDAETAQAGGTDFAGILHGATTREELEAYPHTVVADSLRILI